MERILKAARASGSLNLSNRSLKEVPDEAYKSLDAVGEGENWWEAVELQKLILAHNEIELLKEDIRNLLCCLLKSLKALDVSSNLLHEIPEEIGSATSLIKFDCSNNQLKELPCSLGNCKDLSDLKAANNSLISLLEDLSNCSKMLKLDIELPEFCGRDGSLIVKEIFGVAEVFKLLRPAIVGANTEVFLCGKLTPYATIIALQCLGALIWTICEVLKKESLDFRSMEESQDHVFSSCQIVKDRVRRHHCQPPQPTHPPDHRHNPTLLPFVVHHDRQPPPTAFYHKESSNSEFIRIERSIDVSSTYIGKAYTRAVEILELLELSSIFKAKNVRWSEVGVGGSRWG
ncbi:hypothetical protein L2E82_50345 [Cichorium intybus]|nr:hypothetical protein L2E82_50345 [Cichorium intybus]